MIKRLLANFAARTGITTMRRKIRLIRQEVTTLGGAISALHSDVRLLNSEMNELHVTIRSLQQSHATAELRAAAWHVDALNQQRRLEDIVVRIGAFDSTNRIDQPTSSSPGT